MSEYDGHICMDHTGEDTKLQDFVEYLGSNLGEKKVVTNLEGDAGGYEKKNKREEKENLEPVGGEPDIPNLD